jgi:ferrochelatase
MTRLLSEEGGTYDNTAQRYDALLIVSFGGPEGMGEVIPFLENVLRGRNVPHERMLEVAHHYELFNGISPINAQNRALIAALQAKFTANGFDLPIYWGNRNWHPLLTDTLRQMANDGVNRALAFFTSGYSSYSGCRQYREDIARAQAEVGPTAPQIDRLRMFYNHPAFIEANSDHLTAAISQLLPDQRTAVSIVFTAHSIPLTMANNSRYVVQLEETCCLVAERSGLTNWKLVYQSRSGSPRQPWLEPDILAHLRDLRVLGHQSVVVLPIGFISDHMEVLYDLDTEAQQLAHEIGLTLIRAATVGTHPAFIQMIYDLILERITANPTRLALGSAGPSHDYCAETCCLSV